MRAACRPRGGGVHPRVPCRPGGAGSAPEGAVQASGGSPATRFSTEVAGAVRPRQQHVTHTPSFLLRSARFLLVFNNCFQFPLLRDQRGAKALAAPACLARTSAADAAVCAGP